MWNQLPFDLLAHVFSFLPPDSLARAASACRHWRTCAEAAPPALFRRHPPWFMAMQTRDRSATCYAHNLILRRWYALPLDFLPHPIRPVSPIGSLLLCRPALACSSLQQLIICNPFSRWHRLLPPPNIPRANPAVGVISPAASGGTGGEGSFRVFVAGGTSSGSASYEATLEVYESERDGWRELGRMPAEFAIRLTVWTPSGSVHAGDSLYWMTSARAYTVVGSGWWREVKVPMAERLECAALVRRRGRLAMFGGTCGGGGCVWELGEGDEWEVVEVVPGEMGRRLLRGKERWGGTRCVGCDGAMCLYRDVGWGMVVCLWREVGEKGGKWEWFWVDGYGGFGELPKVPVKGVLLHPSLAAAAV
ncbi:hypothetical protein ACLOJK_021288 [Asimina triloba]